LSAKIRCPRSQIKKQSSRAEEKHVRELICSSPFTQGGEEGKLETDWSPEKGHWFGERGSSGVYAAKDEYVTDLSRNGHRLREGAVTETWRERASDVA